MPSNEDLKTSILEIDPNADVAELNNADMVSLLKVLRLQQAVIMLDENAVVKDLNADQLSELLKSLQPEDAAAKDAAAAKEKAEAKKKEKAEAKKKSPYTIAKGKAITSKRGILGEGEEIKEKDLNGGKTEIEKLVKSGHIDKN